MSEVDEIRETLNELGETIDELSEMAPSNGRRGKPMSDETKRRLRCNHDVDWNLKEVWEVGIAHSAENGRVSARQKIADGPTGQIVFKCRECGLDWRGNPHSDSAPKYIAKRYEQAQEADV